MKVWCLRSVLFGGGKKRGKKVDVSLLFVCRSGLDFDSKTESFR